MKALQEIKQVVEERVEETRKDNKINRQMGMFLLFLVYFIILICFTFGLYTYYYGEANFDSSFFPAIGILLFFLGMTTWSHLKAVTTDPGKVDKDGKVRNRQIASRKDAVSLEDTITSTEFIDEENANLSGEVTTCTKCEALRTERVHHCSTCQKCVYKLDHHCPWINNCVGFYNSKFFFLFLFYLWWLTLVGFVVITYNQFYSGKKPNILFPWLPWYLPYYQIVVLFQLIISFNVFAIVMTIKHLLNLKHNKGVVEDLKGIKTQEKSSFYEALVEDSFGEKFGLNWFLPFERKD